MFFRPTSFFLYLLALWLTIVALAVITALAFIASAYCANCQFVVGSENSTSLSVTNGHAYTSQERIATLFLQNSSYLQSLHIILIQAVATFALAISAPSLWAMIWTRLDYLPKSIKKPLTVASLQNGIVLAQSSSLGSAIFYMITSRSVAYPVQFIVLVTILSLFAPFAVSPIYKSHVGPYLVNASVVVGGGEGDSYGLSFKLDDNVPVGVEAGRALLSARSVLKANITAPVYDVSVAPFLLQHTIQAIWNARIITVVARNSLDCGPSAPQRLSNNTQDVVTLGPMYFSSDPKFPVHNIAVSVAGNKIEGLLTNEPQITTTYLNTSVMQGTGSMTAVTSVIFLAANGTLEGSQQSIVSPEPQSRIRSVDVLVCTSNTTLEISDCDINQGQVKSCSASQTTDLSSYIRNPKYVAIILAASPVTAYYHLPNQLPVYNTIGEVLISSQLPPLSYMTLNTSIDSYNVPLDYIKNVLFSQTAQGLVQGMLTTYSIEQPQDIQVTVTFATSQPILLFAIMALAVVCALAATIVNAPQRNVQSLDTARLLAISRNPQLDSLLEPYGDRSNDMGEDVLNATVVCKYDGRRHKLVLNSDVTDHSVQDTPSTGSQANLLEDEQGDPDGLNKYELRHVQSSSPSLRARHVDSMGSYVEVRHS